MLSARGIEIGSKACVIMFPGWRLEIVSTVLTVREIGVFNKHLWLLCYIDFFVKYLTENCRDVYGLKTCRSNH